MGKFDGILICTDLDGTLLREDRSISAENMEAIRHFQAEGGRFTFVTGRMPFFAVDIYKKILPNAPVGCINGGGLFDYVKGQYLWKRELPRAALELVREVDRCVPGIGIQINTFDRLYFSRENEAMANFRAASGVPNRTRDYDDVTEPIAKVVFGDEEEAHILQTQAILQGHARAAEFDFIRSERTLFEILPKGTNKGSALAILAEHLCIDRKHIVAIGDYNNDVAMLRDAGLGIAVANACPEAKAAADHITVSNEQHAIARVIGDIEDGTLQF